MLSGWWLSLAAVVFFSLKPRVELPLDFWQADKVYHLLGYGWLATLPHWCFSNARRAFWASLLMIPLGLGLEIAQEFVPGRSASLLDLGANTLGAVLGLALGQVTRTRLVSPVTAQKEAKTGSTSH